MEVTNRKNHLKHKLNNEQMFGIQVSNSSNAVLSRFHIVTLFSIGDVSSKKLKHDFIIF